MKCADFLVEIGTEELPPTALRSLMDDFAAKLLAAIDAARLEHGVVRAFASPRRLAVVINDLATTQANRKVMHKGPPLNIAFDDAGNPTPAATAFAKKCGATVDELQRSKTDKGEWLSYESTEFGKTSTELMGPLVENALSALPIPRRMRWGDGDIEFVRPVHWVVLLQGKSVIDAIVMGIQTSNESRGHRVHSHGPLVIKTPGSYLDTLEKDGHVIADFDRRRELIEVGVTAAAAKFGGSIVNGEALFDEVTALVEWPVPLPGSFEDAFLSLPREVIVSTLTGQQRYFPLANENGDLLPQFIAVANIESKDPDQVREGNERVIRPRLADATFFWDNDRRQSLISRQDRLRDIVYQRGLGSLYDKSVRVAATAVSIAAELDIDAVNIERAAMLCKCDLLTGMVGEFPELQGLMGRYYAESDGEPSNVATAIGEHYRPRFAGDELPGSEAGQILALADKLDTLAGVFSIGKKPSGNRDPFGLRRAALGIIRISVECALDIDLQAAIAGAVEAQPKGKLQTADVTADLYTFIVDRLRHYCLDRDTNLATETFDAVLSRQPTSLLDFERRLAAVQTFINLDEAASLAAANKRIANILRQAGGEATASINETLLQDAAELALFEALSQSSRVVRPLLDEQQYTEALCTLATLRGPVDRFFDDVMVMAEDDSLKHNRLALLGELRKLFLDIADISRLAIV